MFYFLFFGFFFQEYIGTPLRPRFRAYISGASYLDRELPGGVIPPPELLKPVT